MLASGPQGSLARCSARTRHPVFSPTRVVLPAPRNATLTALLQTAEAAVESAYSPYAAPYRAPQIDSEHLNQKLEAKAKALIALEEEELPTRARVRVRLHSKLGLGEAWKIVGRVPELGRFVPEVAPYLQWSNGDVWTYEGRVRPGTWTFKMVLKKADRSYVWEQGQDRILDVPEDAGADDVIELEINDIKM